MRDIGTRIQRYRLSRYASPAGSLLRRLRWALPVLVVWLAYVALFSEHSLLRMWRLSREGVESRKALESNRKELGRLENEMMDPAAQRREAERLLREKNGFARREEIVYRIPGGEPDSLTR